MRKYYYILFILIFTDLIFSQIITSEPTYPTANDSIVIYYDATKGNQELEDFSGEIYAHTGLITENSTDGTDWEYLIADWSINLPKAKLERVEGQPNLYKLVIGYPREFYIDHTTGNPPPADEKIEKLAFVFRNNDGTKEGKTEDDGDIFYQLYELGITVVIDSPQVENKFNSPMRSPIFKELGDTLNLRISAAAIGTQVDSFLVLKNDTEVLKSDSDSLVEYKEVLYNCGGYEYSAIAIDTSGRRDTTRLGLMVNPEQEKQAIPEGIKPGINYQENGDVILALFAPYKDFIYVIGDFNDWQVAEDYFMKMDSVSVDSVVYWCRIKDLANDQYYGFQYLIDGELRIAEPYTELVLDAWHDQYIDKSTFPDMPQYPYEKTEELVGVIYNKTSDFNWTDSEFQPPDKEKLVIYECLIRDFISEHNYQTMLDTLSYLKRLGINAIELMPINEFEGNSSWGYNPSFYFAPDKYYGPPESLKKFVNACHENGIAVIGDLVLNHSYGQSPLVRMYWNASQNQPAANNPWYNEKHNFFNPSAQWGYDLDHDSKHTEYFVDRATSYWITEFHFDGYRFDFTKGFTNTTFPASGDNSWGSDYNRDRIQNLKRMTNQMWNVNPDAYAIFEHLAVNQEERELANHGVLLWGNMNYNYNEAAMSYHSDGKSDFSWGYYDNRDWEQPNLVTYMESHDEERLMYKNLEYGYNDSSYYDKIYYDITELPIALNRMELANAFFLTYPGPKMIWQFGELGYDKSIDSYGGRLAEKPPAWELGYNEKGKRLELFSTIQNLIQLRKNNSIFTSPATNVTMDVDGTIKKIKLTGSGNVFIVGNFGVISHDVEVNFFHGGNWFDFFSGDTLNISGSEFFVYGPGEFHIYSDRKFFTPPENPVKIEDQNKTNLPNKFTLTQNYPNPFNSSTIFEYSVEKESNLKVRIYDLQGRLVFFENIGRKSPGYYKYHWNGHNQFDEALASGIYFLIFERKAKRLMKKMTYFK
ncbi:MAG: T9SS type A sorting domain-containing protein [Candidatus Marinimicrobia bacterium]|nr:T9SS type A sorting domain-containing protein [Candidatus Neomarinimicrobiota bacterium]